MCAAIAARKLSVSEYTRELLSACRENADLNAFITLDEDRAMECAQQKDHNPSTGLLHGLPVGLKDAIGTAELPTTAATPALHKHRPKQDAEVVQPLLEAGAFVLGKLNLHELSYGITSNNAHTAPVRNPYDQTRIPGGSSGGSGAAVAAGLLPAALGTDTGGSVRIPAALCGVVGFRPTTGRYSQKGIVPVSHTRDTAGPICRSVDDVAMIDAVITRSADQLERLKPAQLHIGVPNQYYLDNLHPETRSIFEARLADLRAAGWLLTKVDIEGIEAPMEGCGFPIALYETKGNLISYLKQYAADGPSFDQLLSQVKSPDVAGVLASLNAPEFEAMAGAYQDAIKNRRPKLQSIFDRAFSDKRLDAIIFPTTILPACLIGEDETTQLNGADVPVFPTYINNTDPGSIAGIPGISVPAGLTSNGLPVGIELDGPARSDRHLLAVATMLEEVLPPATQPNL